MSCHINLPLSSLKSALEGMLTGPLHHHVVLSQTVTPAQYKTSVSTMVAHMLGDNTFGGTSRLALIFKVIEGNYGEKKREVGKNKVHAHKTEMSWRHPMSCCENWLKMTTIRMSCLHP